MLSQQQRSFVVEFSFFGRQASNFPACLWNLGKILSRRRVVEVCKLALAQGVGFIDLESKGHRCCELFRPSCSKYAPK